MRFNWQGILKEWQRMEQRSQRWKEDLVRGWREIQSAAAPLADRSFAEIEALRLRYRLDRIDRRLFEAYQTLGRRVTESWAGENLLSEEERKRDSRRIDLLSEERKRIMDQMKEMEAFLSNPERRFQREENDAWRS